MPRIKICGVTVKDQALAIAELGVDAIGLNFVSSAARRVDLKVAEQICSELKGVLSLVAVFMDTDPAEVERVLATCDPDHLHFHGDEHREDCVRYGLPYLKTVRMGSGETAQAVARRHPDACALLLDAYVDGQSGGTGKQFDWQTWPTEIDRRLMLAGGLAPDNVVPAIRQTQPWAVDVAGGVEGEVKGVKDLAKVRQFVNQVRSLQ